MNYITVIMCLIGLTLTTAVGCPAPAGVTYLGDSNNVDAVATPNGFEITPKEAEQIRIQHAGNSIAVHHIYADDSNYYICDGFLGSKAAKAVKSGLVINGKTGDVVDRESGNE